MRRFRWILTALITFILIYGSAWAAEKNTSLLPWEKGYVNLGGYFATLDSSFRLGLDNIGLGVDINMEDFLGLDSSEKSFRLDAGYRFGKSRRHMIDFSWFRFHREAEKVLTEDVELPPELGGGTLPTGATVVSLFNFDIYKLKYHYSFFMDDRINFKIGGGLYIMPIKFGLGEIGKEFTEESITAPLPVVSLGFDLAITPKWILKNSIDLFYLKLDNFEGKIWNTQIALEYRAWKHVAIGAGFDSLGVDVEVIADTDYPGLGFSGSVGFNYFGAQLYVKVFYL